MTSYLLRVGPVRWGGSRGSYKLLQVRPVGEGEVEAVTSYCKQDQCFGGFAFILGGWGGGGALLSTICRTSSIYSTGVLTFAPAKIKSCLLLFPAGATKQPQSPQATRNSRHTRRGQRNSHSHPQPHPQLETQTHTPPPGLVVRDQPSSMACAVETRDTRSYRTTDTEHAAHAQTHTLQTISPVCTACISMNNSEKIANRLYLVLKSTRYRVTQSYLGQKFTMKRAMLPEC